MHESMFVLLYLWGPALTTFAHTAHHPTLNPNLKHWRKEHVLHFPHLPTHVIWSSQVWIRTHTHTPSLSLSLYPYSWDMFSCCAATALHNPLHPCFYLSFGSTPRFPTQFLACQFPSPSNAEWCSRGARNLEVQGDWGRPDGWAMRSIWEVKAGKSWIMWKQLGLSGNIAALKCEWLHFSFKAVNRKMNNDLLSENQSTESLLKLLYFVRLKIWVRTHTH